MRSIGKSDRLDNGTMDVLARISRHLGSLAAHVLHIEEAISGGCSTLKQPDAKAIRKLQSLDFLRQSLEDMETAVSLIARDDVDQNCRSLRWKIGIETLKLESSRQIFLSDDGSVDLIRSGDVDLF